MILVRLYKLRFVKKDINNKDVTMNNELLNDLVLSVKKQTLHMLNVIVRQDGNIIAKHDLLCMATGHAECTVMKADWSNS